MIMRFVAYNRSGVECCVLGAFLNFGNFFLLQQQFTHQLLS